MTSRESNNSNVSKANGIHIEIWEPELIVLPIPENKSDANTLLQIQVFITNNTATTFPLIDGILMPELVKPEDELLQPQKLINRTIAPNQYDGIEVPPGRSLVRSLIAKLSWQNNLLEVQATISKSFQVPINLEYTWSFKPLQLGTYQLRFTYSSPRGLHTGNIGSKEGSAIELLASPWASLRLVEPVGTDNSSVEVDSIRFKTVVPEQISIKPSTQPDSAIPVQLGMQITNNTSTPFHFIVFDSLIPQLMGVDSSIPCLRTGGGNAFKAPLESDSHLALPGESVTLFPKAHLIWQKDGLLKLIVFGRGTTCWLFSDLKPGTYRIQMIYRSPTNESDRVFEDLWMGMVHTPFVEFHLIQP